MRQKEQRNGGKAGPVTTEKRKKKREGSTDYQQGRQMDVTYPTKKANTQRSNMRVTKQQYDKSI